MKGNVFKSGYMVGGCIPRPLFDKVNLLSLYLSTPKAHIIKELLEKRVKEEDLALMTHILAQRAIKEWERRLKERKSKRVYTRTSFAKYEDEVEQTMVKRNIAPAHIQQTIMEMRRIYEENKGD